MRLWPRRARPERPPRPAPARPYESLDNLEHLVDEGYLVAAAAMRLSTKNDIILTTLRDGGSWNEAAAIELTRQAADTLIAELTETAARLTRESERAAPLDLALLDASDGPGGRRPSRTERARLRRERRRLERQREEAERLVARTRTVLGVIDRVKAARDDDEQLRQIALRARDDTLAELVQARLIPRATKVRQTEEQQREAIAGVKADLARLLEERTGY